MRIDLHTHTYYSDGSFSPKEVVELAVKRGVRYLAITDHDVVSGVEEALEAAKGKRITVIPGIEIDASVRCSDNSVHIVGLYVNPNSAPLRALSDYAVKISRERTVKRLKAVNKHFGVNLTFDDLQKTTHGMPGRAHIGMVLLERGLVKGIWEGINITGRKGPCYGNVVKRVVSAEDAIARIHDAGGLAALAHLAAYRNEGKFTSYTSQMGLAAELKGYGLDGLEIYIPNLSAKDRKFGEALAGNHGLLISGGSDFHDEKLVPQNHLGYLNMPKRKLSILRN